MKIVNPEGKSTVEDVILLLDAPVKNDYSLPQEEIQVCERLIGGQSPIVKIPVIINTDIENKYRIELYYKLLYTQMGNRIEGKKSKHAIQIDKIFERISNPYAVYAEGGPVADKNMFYGRDEIVQVIFSYLQENKHTNTIIYGQKRSGKSSVLWHIKDRLKFPLIPIHFSMGEIIYSFSVDRLLNKICYLIKVEFEKLKDKGYPPIIIELPNNDELKKNSDAFFLFMSKLMESLSKYLSTRTRSLFCLSTNSPIFMVKFRMGLSRLIL